MTTPPEPEINADVLYRITKAQCEDGISGVCPGCGSEVTAIETVDNAGNPTYWSGCESCCVFTHGCPWDIFRVARRLVAEDTLRPYSHIDRRTYPEHWLTEQTRAAVRIVWRTKRLLEGDAERSPS